LENIHASLLVLRELITQTGNFLSNRFAEVCEIVFRYKDHKESLIRRTVISLIPDLAQFDANSFVLDHLNVAMSYLLANLKKEKLSALAFIAIGKVALAVGRSANHYLETILQAVNESLTIKSKKVDASIFECISMLAIAIGTPLTKFMPTLLDNMFLCELSDALRQALMDLSSNIPSTLPIIQERMLDMLSLILCDQPFVLPGTPSKPNFTPVLQSHLEPRTKRSRCLETGIENIRNV
jgi:FKBP12-rapamycin complex-associated protein